MDYLKLSRDTGQISNFGPNNGAFEQECRERYAPEAGVSACASCTVGLSAALLALGVTRPVIVPAFTFPATHDAVRGAGLRAVVADVEATTGIVSAETVSAILRKANAGAVLAVRPYGIWSDLSGLAAACRSHGVPLVIDNASGFGVEPDVVARFACPDATEVFSLHATKPAAVGEGGLLLYPPALHDRVRAALNFGMVPGTANKIGRGLNGKMDEVRAAVARAMLRQLPAKVGRRQAMAATLGQLAIECGVQPFVRPGEEWRLPWQCFPLLLPEGTEPDIVAEGCALAGLQVRRYYHPVVGTVASKKLPGAATLAGRVLCLPVYDGVEADRAAEMWGVFHAALTRAGHPGPQTTRGSHGR